MFRKCDHKSLYNAPQFTYGHVESQKFSGDKPTVPIFRLGSRRCWLLAFDVGPNQSLNQSFNVIFHACTGQTHTRTSRRHNSWSAASDGSKLTFQIILNAFLSNLSTSPSANITSHFIFSTTFNPVHIVLSLYMSIPAQSAPCHSR